MAGQVGNVGRNLLEGAILMLQAREVAAPHLKGHHFGDLGDFGQLFHRVGSFRPVRVLVEDNRNPCAFSHILEETDGCFWCTTKAQPMVGWHEQNGISARFLGGQCMVNRLKAAVTADAGNNLHLIAHFVGHDAGHFGPFVAAQPHYLAGVAVADQTAHPINAS